MKKLLFLYIVYSSIFLSFSSSILYGSQFILPSGSESLKSKTEDAFLKQPSKPPSKNHAQREGEYPVYRRYEISESKHKSF